MKRFTAWILVMLMLVQSGISFGVSRGEEPAETAMETISIQAPNYQYHTVAFTVNGEEVTTLFVVDGASIETLPAAPEVDGAAFLGWYDGNSPFSTEETVLADRQLRAVYREVRPELEEKKRNANFSYKDVGQYVTVEIFGTVKKNQMPDAARDESFSGGREIPDAWTVTGIKNKADLTVEAVVTALPAEGTLSAFPVQNGALLDLVAENLQIGDTVVFDLAMKGPDGIALAVEEPEEEAGEIEGALYANDDLYITGMVPGKGIIDVQPVEVEIDGEKVIAAYDIRIYVNEQQKKKGHTWQPADRKVKVHLRNDQFVEGEYGIYHLADETAEPEYLETVKAEEGWIAFEAESFSVYAITEVRLNQTVTTSDGATYDIQVTYGKNAGIPMEGTALQVAEVLPGEPGYDGYISASAESLGAKAKNVVFSRIFDIKIVDENDTSIVYEPTEEVEVSITLKDSALDTYANVGVLHFVTEENFSAETFEADSYSVQQMDTAVSGETVEFTADSFSVFVVTGYKLEKEVVAGDGKTYRITVTFTEDAELPEDVELSVTELTDDAFDACVNQAADLLGTKACYARVFDIALVNAAGERLQPAVQVDVNVKLLDAGSPENGFDVVSFAPVSMEKSDSGEEQMVKTEKTEAELAKRSTAGEQPERLPSETEGNTVSFGMEGFSLCAILETVLTQTVTTSDGATYDIRVTYGSKAGIPMEGTALLVTEVLPEDEGYDGYVAASADTLGAKTKNVVFSRIFDIKIVDENDHSVIYEPSEEVEVSITLAGSTLDSYANVGVLHFVTEENFSAETFEEDSYSVQQMDSVVSGETVEFAADSFSVFVVAGYKLEKEIVASDGLTYRITVTFTEGAELPENVDLSVEELTGEIYEEYLGRTAVAMNAVGFEFARIFDISIVDGEGNKVQPGEPVEVLVELLDVEKTELPFSVVHFATVGNREKSDGDTVGNLEESDGDTVESLEDLAGYTDQPELLDAVTDGNTVSFITSSFSAYAIVEGPSLNDAWVKNLAELADNIPSQNGFYLAYGDLNSIKYFKSDLNNNSAFVETTEQAAAAKWFFERTDTDYQYKIYTEVNGERRYMYNPSGNLMGLTESSDGATAFDLSKAADFKFYFKKTAENKWLQHSGSGDGIRLWTDKNNATNSQIRIGWVYDEQTEQYHLDGKSYGLMNWSGGVAGKALMAQSSAENYLGAKALTVMFKRENREEHLFVPNDADITMWTFNWLEGDRYTLSAEINGSPQYLSITNDGIALSDTPTDSCRLQVVPGTGVNAGKICLKAGNTALTYFDIEKGFGVGNTAGSEWLYLVEESTLTQDYFKTYTAQKVGVSDEAVHNGSRIIVYTRTWDDEKKQYDYHAVDSDGALIPVFESGDNIEWVGEQFNTLLWNFVEYSEEGTNVPSGFYELFNQYSEKYIAPQISGNQILSGGTIGINMPGRTEGYYQTKIIAWDEGAHAYVGLKADVATGTIVPCPLDEADDFYFAILHDLPVDDSLHSVATVDHEQYGITMTIYDFSATGNEPAKNPMSAFLGSGAGGAVTTLVQGLLSTDLTDGYPTASGGSLGTYLNTLKHQQVNKLFIQSTYNGTGYFEFDSSQNFASLNADNNDFIVYREIGTSDNKSTNTMKHGQFFPWNDIQPGVFASVNRQNLYSATGRELSEEDPRKYEQLYLVRDPNYYFVMELEASFTQTPNGHDAWGHDIIYEFTGDDDFWLYVDGELVIDLGGIHSAVPGSVNFATGQVNVNGQQKTLYELFRSNYVARGDSNVDAKLNAIFEKKGNNYVFRQNTTHTMKIFYMERGAGASNLHMRFNLASVKPGTVELSKTLSQQNPSDDLSGAAFAEFPYQIFYRTGKTESVNLSGVAGSGGNWATGNENCVTVNSSGVVTAIGPGSATVSGGGKEFLVEVRLVAGTRYIIVYDEDGKVVTDLLGEEILLSNADSVKVKGSKTNVPYRESLTIPGTSLTYDDVFLLKPGKTAVISLPQQAAAYRIVECGINKNVYSKVSVNGVEITGTITDIDTRFDYATAWATAGDVPRVVYDNEVRELRNLTIKKRLFDVNGDEITNQPEVTDTAEFSFRLYLATEYDEVVTDYPANIQPYYVKDPSGYYCMWNASTQSFDSLGEADFAQLTEEQKKAAKVNTSMYGAISRIRAGYSVEFRGLLPGMQYRVEERSLEIPDGYSFKEYEKNGERVDEPVYRDDIPGVVDSIIPDIDTSVAVQNFKGFGLRINKTWTDAVFMQNRDPVYFAVYTDDGNGNLNMVEGSARQMPYGGEQTLYWFYEELPVDHTDFDNYVVREVTVSDPQISSEGVVTGTITPVQPDSQITLQGRQKGETADAGYEYTVLYGNVQTPANSNVRVFPVTNDRPSITLWKTDWQGNALAGAEFTLTDGDNVIGTFTSDDEGFITLVFLGSSKTYTLTEIRSPQGYCAMESPMSIAISGEEVTVSGPDAENYHLDKRSSPPTLTVKNRPYTFSVVKVGEQPAGGTLPQAGVCFELHRKKTVDGVTGYDEKPEQGFENLVTNGSGIIPGLNAALAPGDYQLREKSPLSGYCALGSHVYFTVSETGVITLGDHPPEAFMNVSEDESNGSRDYTVTILNRLIPVAPTGVRFVLWPFCLMLAAGLLLLLTRCRRKEWRSYTK